MTIVRTLDETIALCWAHIVRQGRRATDGYRCAYLTHVDPDTGRYVKEGGIELKCAVGAFLPDGHPGQGCKGTVTNLIHAYPDLLPDDGIGALTILGLSHEPTMRVWSEMQALHDNGIYWHVNSAGEYTYSVSLAAFSAQVKQALVEF